MSRSFLCYLLCVSDRLFADLMLSVLRGIKMYIFFVTENIEEAERFCHVVGRALGDPGRIGRLKVVGL